MRLPSRPGRGTGLHLSMREIEDLFSSHIRPLSRHDLIKCCEVLFLHSDELVALRAVRSVLALPLRLIVRAYSHVFCCLRRARLPLRRGVGGRIRAFHFWGVFGWDCWVHVTLF